MVHHVQTLTTTIMVILHVIAWVNIVRSDVKQSCTIVVVWTIVVVAKVYTWWMTIIVVVKVWTWWTIVVSVVVTLITYSNRHLGRYLFWNLLMNILAFSYWIILTILPGFLNTSLSLNIPTILIRLIFTFLF